MPNIQQILSGFGQGLQRFNQGAQVFGPDPNNPMSYGMDMPEQGGIGGNMQIPPPMVQAPQSGPPVAEGPGIFSNPVLNPTVDPSTIEQGPMTDYTGTGNQSPQDPGFNEDAYYNQYMDRYKPSHTAQDYYNQLMMQYPTRDMHPSIMRRLAASFAGFGAGIRGQNGYEVGQKIMDEPFNEKLLDWKNKMQPALSSANLERYENVNERQLLGQEASRATSARREDIHQQDINRKTADDIRRAESRRANTAFRYWKQQHPNHVYQEDKQGYVIGIDPQTNQAQPVYDENGERLEAAKLPEESRMEIQHGYKMEEIGAHEAAAQTRAETSKQGEFVIDDPEKPGTKILVKKMPDGSYKRATLEGKQISGDVTKPSTKSSTGGNESQFQIAQKQRNIAQQIINTDPDAKDWLTWDGNRVQIDKDNNSGSAPPELQKKVRMWRDKIYGTTTVHMIGPDGKGYSVPPDKVEKFKANGYKVQ